EGVELCGLLSPGTAIPVHYEGWSHFHEGRAAVERAIAAAPADIRSRFRVLDLGVPAEIARSG
nr:MBL fold metallo-hydrolase [Chloroflexota bacterium]